MWYANIIAGVAIFFLGIGTSVLAWRLPYTMESSPGPGFLPLWLGIIMAICSAFVIAQDLKNKESYKSAKLFVPETVKCIQVLALIVAVFLVLPILGFRWAWASSPCLHAHDGKTFLALLRGDGDRLRISIHYLFASG